jgi:hypothetical protein
MSSAAQKIIPVEILNSNISGSPQRVKFTTPPESANIFYKSSGDTVVATYLIWNIFLIRYCRLLQPDPKLLGNLWMLLEQCLCMDEKK